jgi:hypothetical protein
MAGQSVADWEDLQGRESWDSLMRAILLIANRFDNNWVSVCVGECLVIDIML